MSAPDQSREMDRFASDLFAAVERADMDAIERSYAPDVTVWINVNPRTQNREESLKLLRSFTQRVEGLHYAVESREFFPGGFVQRHKICGKTRSGEVLDIPVCMVAHLEEGKIARLFEYMDSAAIAAVFA